MNLKADVVGVLLFVAAPFVYAQVPVHETDKTFYVSFGGYNVFRADSTMTLVNRDLGAGAALSPTDTLGLDIETTVLKLDAHYRLSDTSQIAASWYNVDTDAYKTLQTAVDWVDPDGNEITIEAGSEIASSFVYDILKVGYYWSFHRTDKVELIVGGGLHVSQFEVELDIKSDATGNPSVQSTRHLAHTVPLPTLGVGLNYHITPELSWFLRTEGFYLKYDDWDGSYSETQLGIEYAILENFGIGMALASDNLTVTETTSIYKFKYDNRLNGINLFVSWFM